MKTNVQSMPVLWLQSWEMESAAFRRQTNFEHTICPTDIVSLCTTLVTGRKNHCVIGERTKMVRMSDSSYLLSK